MKTTKPFGISKQIVVQAWQRVKANQGASGVDGQSLEEFESKLHGNLYKLWNRMSSGTYFPSAVKTVAIPKKTGGERNLGIPTVYDRVAQMVAKLYFEPLVEAHFDADSYGCRPNKSAHQALAVTRKRCWQYDWVLEFDIKGLFDNIDHDRLMKAVLWHTDNRWLLLYIERWLKAPIQLADGTTVSRSRGVPQGGVISPVLSNLFLHYAFDKWMRRTFPSRPFCRYADDGLVHCQSEWEAITIRNALADRLQECGLEMHPEKTKIVYCKDGNRKENHPVTSFDFLGYTFRPRFSKNRWGQHFTNFSPGMSAGAGKAIRQTVRSWNLQLCDGMSLAEIARRVGVKIQGWINYYGRFYISAMYGTLEHINRKLYLWAIRKYKKLKRSFRRAACFVGKTAVRYPDLFPHWKLGIKPTVG